MNIVVSLSISQEEERKKEVYQILVDKKRALFSY